MADITMCHGNGCPKRDQCYRFTAKPSPYWQSWASFELECTTNDYRYYITNE